MTGTQKKRLNVFERYLTVWVALCMAAGVVLGKALPGLTDTLRRFELGDGSQINAAIALLIWLMVYPMMLKIDLGSIWAVRQRPIASTRLPLLLQSWFKCMRAAI